MKNVLVKKGQSLNDVYVQRLEEEFFKYLDSIKTILENRLANHVECKLVQRGIFYHIQIKPVDPHYTEESLFNDIKLSQFIDNFMKQITTNRYSFIYEESYSFIAIDKDLISNQVNSIKDKDSYSLMFNLGL